MRPSWNEYFMAIAKIVSTRSTCTSRPVGAVIVRDKQILTTGYNGSMPGAPHCSDEEPANGAPYCFRRYIEAPEDDKYNYCRSSHAEANAIAQAARSGISLEGSTLYITLGPCYVCMKLLAMARVRHVYYEYSYESSDKKRDSFWAKIVKECGIETYEQLRVTDSVRHLISRALEYPTSGRNLLELPRNDWKDYFYNHVAGYDESLIAIYKEILSSVLKGTHDGEKISGYNVEFNIPRTEGVPIPGSRYKAAIKFLRSRKISEGGILTSSGMLRELFLRTISTSGLSGTISGDQFWVSAMLKGGKLHFRLGVHEVDLLQDFLALVDGADIILNDLYMNLLDHHDISLEKGDCAITIDKPFIRPEAVEQAKQIL